MREGGREGGRERREGGRERGREGGRGGREGVRTESERGVEGGEREGEGGIWRWVIVCETFGSQAHIVVINIESQGYILL